MSFDGLATTMQQIALLLLLRRLLLLLFVSHLLLRPLLLRGLLLRSLLLLLRVHSPLLLPMPKRTKEQGPGAPLQGVTVALARGVRGIPLSKFEHMSGPETNLTLNSGRVWQMRLPCIMLIFALLLSLFHFLVGLRCLLLARLFFYCLQVLPIVCNGLGGHAQPVVGCVVEGPPGEIAALWAAL